MNIAVSIVHDAALNKFDKGILVSGDTDFMPVFKAVRAIYKTKKLGVLFSFMRKNAQMKNVADFQIKSKFSDY